MFKHTMTYPNFNGQETTGVFYFNLTKAELMQMEMSPEAGGGLKAILDSIVETKDQRLLINIFQDLMEKSYGIKSTDGEYFTKNSEVLAKFKSTNAYSELYMMMVSNADFAAHFVNSIMPQDLIEQARAELAKRAEEEKNKNTTVIPAEN